MRPSNKSRSRNKPGNLGGNPNGNNNPNNSNNYNRRPLGNIINRVFESAGPDGKVRGTPQQIIDKYQALARDAQLAGDRVAAESFLQHSEHYSRMLGEAQSQQSDGRQSLEREEGQRGDAPREDGRREDPRREDGSRDQVRSEGFDQPRPPRPEGQQPQRRPQPAFSSGLAMIDPAEDDDLGGLIETPESAAAAPPPVAPAVAPAPNGGVNGAHHAAADEPAEETSQREAPKRARTRRKARPEGETDTSSPSE